MGLFLIFIKSKINTSNIYLGLLLLCYSLFFLPLFFEAIGILDELPHIIRLNFFSGSLVGPLTYLYCKSSIHKVSLKLWKNIYHIIPFLVSIIFFIPTLTKSGSEKLEIYQRTITEGKVPEPSYVILTLCIIAIIYTIISINLVRKYLLHIKNLKSNIDPSFHRWLLFLSTSFLFPIITVVLISTTNIESITVLGTVFALASFVAIVYGTLTLKPKFFEDIPDQILSPPDESEEASKYQKSKLQEIQKDKYQDKILAFIKEEKPYLNPEITINQFSEQVNIPSYYVSQIINERMNINYLDFINSYRIEESKSKLTDEKFSHYTIVTIAFDSGFNSKTAFYSAFKKYVGMTPSQYRKKEQKK